MIARVKGKIKGVRCSLVFPVLLFLTAVFADECGRPVHIYSVLKNPGNKMDIK